MAKKDNSIFGGANGINLEDVDTSSDFPQIKKGIYEGKIHSMEFKESSKSGDKYLNIGFQIDSDHPDFGSQCVFHIAMLEGAGAPFGEKFITKMILTLFEDMVDTSNFVLKDFVDSGMAVGKKCAAKIKETKSKEYGDGNDIVEFLPAGSSGKGGKYTM